MSAAAALEGRARAFVEALAAGRFAEAVAQFDATMAGALPADKLGATWAQLQAQAGAFGGIDEEKPVKLIAAGAHVTALVMCKFEYAQLVARVVFDAEGQIAGLFFAPSPPEVTWAPPGYAREGAFTERPVEVGTAPALPGTLTLPVGPGPFPVAVLVHGSGPNDADESVGAAKPFKDLAWGLASRGVAVIRYVKRSRHAPAGMVGVKEEVIDGARDAVALSATTPELDPARVVVIGHSQGAELAPRIAAETPGVAGIVMLAAPARPLQDMVVDQFAYLTRLAPENEPLKKLAAGAHAFKQRLDDPALSPDEDVLFPGGNAIKGSYFLSMRGYDPVKVAGELAIPILVLHGERDYQVTAPDIERYERALGGRANVTIKRCPGLNHLFIEGEGPPSPAEYGKPGHVAEQVIDDVAAWVKKPG